MSMSNVTRGEPWMVAANPPITTNSTLCFAKTRSISSGLNSGSGCIDGGFRASGLLDEAHRPRVLPNPLCGGQATRLPDDGPVLIVVRTDDPEVEVEAGGADELADGLQ